MVIRKLYTLTAISCDPMMVSNGTGVLVGLVKEAAPVCAGGRLGLCPKKSALFILVTFSSIHHQLLHQLPLSFDIYILHVFAQPIS